MTRPTGSCHCGAVRVTLPRRPRSLTNCDCSICRRYGTLWAYFEASAVVVEAALGATDRYPGPKRHLDFVRCRRCGCVVHWQDVRAKPRDRIGVNARLFEPADLGPVRIRLLDGAVTERYLDAA